LANSRVSRGRKTEQIVADFLSNPGPFPSAERRPASLPGSDIINTPGYSIEVKARRAFNPKAWVKQADDAAEKYSAEHPDEEYPPLPVVIMRPDGMGETTVMQWPVFMMLNDWVWMVERIKHLETELYGKNG